jgi:hypothetical protein
VAAPEYVNASPIEFDGAGAGAGVGPRYIAAMCPKLGTMADWSSPEQQLLLPPPPPRPPPLRPTCRQHFTCTGRRRALV